MAAPRLAHSIVRLIVAIAASLLLASCTLAAKKAAVTLTNALPGAEPPQRAIESAVVLVLGFRGDFTHYVNLSQQFDAAQARGDAAAAERLRAAIGAVVEQSMKSRGAYNQQVLRAAKDYTADTITAARDAVVARYEEQEARSLIPYARLFAEHVLAYQKSGQADVDKWHEELLR